MPLAERPHGATNSICPGQTPVPRLKISLFVAYQTKYFSSCAVVIRLVKMINNPLYNYLLIGASFVLLSTTTILQAQTCCSGGVPLSGNLGLPVADQNTWQFSLSYDLNVLQTLKTGTEKLDERNRKRTTHSIMFETGYTFSKRFSADIFLSYIRQERNIRNPGLPSQNLHTSGIGDAVLLLKYNIITEGPVVLTIGVGPKLPTGASDLTKNGILLGADLQPGSGAWMGYSGRTLSINCLAERV